MSGAYYNEIDPFAAAWLRELIKAGQIADGEVDERSIEDVTPNELSKFTQCHFFAGIGVWSYALRQAGWPDDQPVWTGSCPCQPFSAAGKGGGFDDERHLWPSWYWLIEQCRPSIIFGEQVASKATGPWFDLVQVDLERMGYAFGVVPFPSAGVGAPHIRDRAFWVADSDGEGLERCGQSGEFHDPQRWSVASGHVGEGGGLGRVAYSDGDRRQEAREYQPEARNDGLVGNSAACRMGNSEGDSDEFGKIRRLGSTERKVEEEARQGEGEIHRITSVHGNPGPTNGFWANADWLFCRDGKWRPVEPGTFPLAHESPARVGRLRGYGNAINAEAAKTFIESVMELAA